MAGLVFWLALVLMFAFGAMFGAAVALKLVGYDSLTEARAHIIHLWTYRRGWWSCGCKCGLCRPKRAV